MTLSKGLDGPTFWTLSVPLAAESLLSSEASSGDVLASATTSLAQALSQHVSADPSTIQTIIGPTDVVPNFIAAWVSLQQSHGTTVQFTPLGSMMTTSYATLASLAPLPTAVAKCTTALARAEDIDALAALRIAFQAEAWVWTTPNTMEVERATLREPVAAALVWICRVEGVPAGFIVVGRATPRTVAVRNVFVASEFRRKGVALAMTRAVTGYYLGEKQHGLEGVPEGPPSVGFKEQVCLNVANEGAKKMYRRVGYLIPEFEGEVVKGGVDSTTGQKSWMITGKVDLITK